MILKIYKKFNKISYDNQTDITEMNFRNLKLIKITFAPQFKELEEHIFSIQGMSVWNLLALGTICSIDCQQRQACLFICIRDHPPSLSFQNSTYSWLIAFSRNSLFLYYGDSIPLIILYINIPHILTGCTKDNLPCIPELDISSS